jgi:tripartite-type tricarboxylate transporter receptor subunit TctC
MKKLLALGVIGVATALWASAYAQVYPSKFIRAVIPYPPGGVDVVMRLLVPGMEKELGQPVVIDYKPGASGMIGQEYVARAEPDGYTLLATASNPWVVTPAMRKKTPYDPIKDFTPISIVLEGVNLIVANPAFPASNVRELLDYAKKNPGKVAFATSGIGSFWHLDGELIKRLAGVDMLHAPFQGFGPMIPPVMSGQVQIGLITYQIAQGMLQAGKLKMIGILNTNARVKPLLPPGIQTVKEVLPAYESGASWTGYAGPANLPRPIVMRLNAAIVKTLNQPELQERFARDRAIATGSTPEEFAERIARDFAHSQKVVKEANIPLLD